MYCVCVEIYKLAKQLVWIVSVIIYMFSIAVIMAIRYNMAVGLNKGHKLVKNIQKPARRKGVSILGMHEVILETGVGGWFLSSGSRGQRGHGPRHV